MKKAVFAGSFDPFTLGHKNIVLRASKLFDEVVVAIALDTGKKYHDINVRKQIVAASLECNNIRIETFEGLLTEFMKKNDINILVRGVRNANDYDYEKSLMRVYRSLLPEMEIVLLPAMSELDHVSSTVVRELCKLDAKLDGYIDTNAEKYVRSLYSEK